MGPPEQNGFAAIARECIFPIIPWYCQNGHVPGDGQGQVQEAEKDLRSEHAHAEQAPKTLDTY